MTCATGTRVCVTCLEEKSLADFPWADRKRGFRRRSCRQCYSVIKKPITARYQDSHRDAIRAAGREYHRANRETRNAVRQQRYAETPVEVRRARKAATLFGITVEQYGEMLERQSGVCAICRREETLTQRGVIRGLGVDHDHDTGAVRGLLCNGCNTMLGMAADDPAVLEAGAAYLRAGGTV